MQVATIFVFLSFGAIASAAIYGVEVGSIEEWWNSYFLKFNSPSGKIFYIDFYDGTIYREKGATSPTTSSGIVSPFLSFVSIDLKIYDIFFKNDSFSFIPSVEESKFNYEKKYSLIRHRLHSFVGPNKKVYKLVYNDGNESNITIAETTSEALDHFQIKTFGPYEKWEHTYDFSENGEFVVDHTLSPVTVLPNRTIKVPKLEPNTFIEENNSYVYLIAKFDTPSGIKYHITNQLNIIEVREDKAEVAEAADVAYITFTEPNGRTYDILFDEENNDPHLVEKNLDENYFGEERLHSFVGPNRIFYRLDHKNDVPILVSHSSEPSNLEITFLKTNEYRNTYVKYMFSDNGMRLFDRVDEIDWTPLNEQPAIPVEEVNSEMANLPFLIFYSNSGNNYHIFTNETHANIAVKRETKNSLPLYISYTQPDGRKTDIYFASGDHSYLETETNLVEKKDLSFWLQSFVTPDQKKYSIKQTLDDDNEWKPSIQLPNQVVEPIDEIPEDGLSVTIQNRDGWKYVYRFTWNGDKLIQASRLPPIHFVDNKVLQSLIGK